MDALHKQRSSQYKKTMDVSKNKNLQRPTRTDDFSARTFLLLLVVITKTIV